MFPITASDKAVGVRYLQHFCTQTDLLPAVLHYHKCRKAPGFSRGDIRHTIFPRNSKTMEIRGHLRNRQAAERGRQAAIKAADLNSSMSSEIMVRTDAVEVMRAAQRRPRPIPLHTKANSHAIASSRFKCCGSSSIRMKISKTPEFPQFPQITFYCEVYWTVLLVGWI